MPSPGTIITFGAVGAVGAAAFMNKRRNSATSTEQQVQSGPLDMSPHAMARRRSKVENDLFEARKQVKSHISHTILFFEYINIIAARIHIFLFS